MNTQIKAEDEQCPSNDFEQGEPAGKCWGDGHHRCKVCKHYREDFKRNGQDYIDFAHIIQHRVIVTSLVKN